MQPLPRRNRMRFEAPARHDVAATLFAHPAYREFSHLGLLSNRNWPDPPALNQALNGARHTTTGQRLSFAAQTPALLADGLHYETRIFETGVIATRERNWHDLFNVLVWLDRLPLKCAINTAYLRESQASPGLQRSRSQCALTHFDEAGAVVVLRDPTLLDLWDAHDWHGLLWRNQAHWAANARVMLFGHALLEHFLVPSILPVAKCLVLRDASDETMVTRVLAKAISTGASLRDPQELRPLPLAGLAGWHRENRREDFYLSAPCFRPLRPGRRYPRPT